MTMWGGRFSQKLDPAAWALNASIDFDRRLGPQDVRGSQAWAQGLLRAGVLSVEEHASLQSGLQQVGQELSSGSFRFDPGDEDIHSAVERRLGELVGPLAGKLHTGRSRNDQVATDLRLWLLESLPALEQAVVILQTAIVKRAEDSGESLMPGYTHLQRAQPVLQAHWWLSHFWPLQRDRQRLAEMYSRVAVLPLGSGALSGTPFPVDRQQLAVDLGFEQASPNSIDAVSDRDFVAEFLFWAALCGVHLSKVAEVMVLFSSAEFGYFELSDAYATGSSLMPQKKNPDVFELARGKAGGLIGSLAGLLATLKGLPSTYDKDLQEDKLPLFGAYDSLIALLPVLAGALDSLTAHPERMRQGLDAAMLATELADYLVGRGVPFREAHALSGQAVQAAASRGISLEALPLEAYQALHPAFGEDVYRVFDPKSAVARRSALGGTAPEAVRTQLEQAKKLIIPPPLPAPQGTSNFGEFA
jgi:argininosuccinate lyase